MVLEISPEIGPLGDIHDRKNFSCGEPSLDTYIERQAGQDVRRRIARVFVATFDDPASIAGFYTLSALAVEASELPAELSAKLPRHPIPAALIGRLAVDQRYQERGLGAYLLMDTLSRALAASESVAIHVVVVDTLDERASDFYQAFGFRLFPSTPKRLFIPLLAAFPPGGKR